jgi:hypothetical protein
MCVSLEKDGPSSYKEVITSPAYEKWMVVMRGDMSSMAKNNIWELIDLPLGYKFIGIKWVFKIKSKVNGSIDKCKARLIKKI